MSSHPTRFVAEERSMAVFTPEQWALAEQCRDLATTNPFDADWMTRHQQFFPDASGEPDPVLAWHPGVGPWGPYEGDGLGSRVGPMVDRVRTKLVAGGAAGDRELEMYETLALYQLYGVFGEELDISIDVAVRKKGGAGAD